MNILIIGQCTLHWGRMEFGNIGNYYIIEPFVRELHATFPGASIKTTFQMSERFCKDERVEVLPMSLYYSWNNDLLTALSELGIAHLYNRTNELPSTTPYIEAVREADLVIDFSGDIWGDNANFLGDDRFLVGLIKDRVAQLLGKRTVMLAGSPGPFNDSVTLEFAKEVWDNFDLVTNREAFSDQILKDVGFDTSNMISLACPAFLFTPADDESVNRIIRDEIEETDKPVVGFILCGWNFLKGPFDLWPREDEDYVLFAEVVEYLESLGVRVYLMSHSNGFNPGVEPFELIHGRDYPIIKQLEDVLKRRGVAKDFFVLNGVYDAWTTKAIIKRFDMLISGRVHAAVAGMSQAVPTVIIDYGHEPKAHKLKGFAQVAGMLDYVVDPANKQQMFATIKRCLNQRRELKRQLGENMLNVQKKAKKNFELLKEVMK